MNVIIANKYSAMLETLNIDIIKSLNGEFTVDDIVAQFQNFYFQRMILDITALKDYEDIKTLQKISISLDMDKVILLLDDSPSVSSPAFLSQIISMGIYNFTKNVEGIMYLYNNPNTYRDVAQYHQINPIVQEPQQVQTIIQQVSPSRGVMILGVKDVTKQAGSTSLVYMMYKELSKNYSVIAIEVGKSDFSYFNDKNLISATDTDVSVVVSKNIDKEAIIIDLNNSPVAMALCHNVIYLIEPSTIKLNRLLMVEPRLLATLNNKKVVLNKSLLNSHDVHDFEYEAKLTVFFNLPPLDERSTNLPVLNELLYKLGFDRQPNDGKVEKKGLFGF